jgi:hypothetical protein
MLLQVRAQPRWIPRIQKFHCAPELGVFDALVVRQIHSVGQCRFFNVALEPWPTGKSMFSRNRELRIALAEACFKDVTIASAAESRMKFSYPLRGSRVACRMFFEQVFRLVLEVNQAGVLGKRFDRHDELPFVCPGPHVVGESQFAKFRL